VRCFGHVRSPFPGRSRQRAHVFTRETLFVHLRFDVLCDDSTTQGRLFLVYLSVMWHIVHGVVDTPVTSQDY